MLSFRQSLPRAFSIQNVNYFRYRFIKFFGNRRSTSTLASMDLAKGLSSTIWNQMLLGYFLNPYGYDDCSFEKNQGRAAFS